MVRFLDGEAEHQQVAGSEALGGFPLDAVAVATLHGAGMRGEVCTVLFGIVVTNKRAVADYAFRQSSNFSPGIHS